MNKSRILFLAQKRALAKNSESKQSEGDSTQVAEASVGNVGVAVDSNVQAEATVTVPVTKSGKRGSESGKLVLRKKQKVSGAGLDSRDGPNSDSEVEEVLPTHIRESRGIPTELVAGASGSGQPEGVKRVPSIGGVEGYTMIRFRTGEGWLGEEVQGKGPLGALDAFSLSPDKARLVRMDDEEVLGNAKEMLGKVRFLFELLRLILFVSSYLVLSVLL